MRELRALEEFGRAVASSLDLGAVLAAIVGRAVALTQADAGAIFAFDPALDRIARPELRVSGSNRRPCPPSPRRGLRAFDRFGSTTGP